MAELSARELVTAAYSADAGERWEQLVTSSDNGTLLHTRRFLSYHGDRFLDRSLMFSQGPRLIAVLPAAEDPQDSATVVSHPGTTYGGLVHSRKLRGEAVLAVLRGACRQLTELGYARLLYSPAPWIYHRQVRCDDLYALFRLGARRSRCTISATLDLDRPGRPSHGRRQAGKLATRSGVSVSADWEEVAAFWPVLEENLAARYAAAPVHSLPEIEHLHALFPGEVLLVVAKLGQEVVGGALLLAAGMVLHAQYLASSARGRDTAALDPVLMHSIELARDMGCRFFDFGTSNEEGGRVLNQALYEFKLSFGAGSAVYEQYELDLQRCVEDVE